MPSISSPPGWRRCCWSSPQASWEKAFPAPGESGSGTAAVTPAPTPPRQSPLWPEPWASNWGTGGLLRAGPRQAHHRRSPVGDGTGGYSAGQPDAVCRQPPVSHSPVRPAGFHSERSQTMTDHGGDWASFEGTYGVPPWIFPPMSALSSCRRPSECGEGSSDRDRAVSGPPVPRPAEETVGISRHTGGLDSLRQWGGGPDLPSGGSPAAPYRPGHRPYLLRVRKCPDTVGLPRLPILSE